MDLQTQEKCASFNYEAQARLVAKGYLQIFGLDYTDSFALMANVVTTSILLTLVAKQK